MTSYESAGSGLPWYHFFWPWFIAILLGLSVTGSLWTVAIAYQHRDVDVRVRPAVTETSAEAVGVAAGMKSPDSRSSEK